MIATSNEKKTDFSIWTSLKYETNSVVLSLDLPACTEVKHFLIGPLTRANRYTSSQTRHIHFTFDYDATHTDTLLSWPWFWYHESYSNQSSPQKSMHFDADYSSSDAFSLCLILLQSCLLINNAQKIDTAHSAEATTYSHSVHLFCDRGLLENRI